MISQIFYAHELKFLAKSWRETRENEELSKKQTLKEVLNENLVKKCWREL